MTRQPTNWWRHYNRFFGDEFDEFWRSHLQQPRRILFIVGLGFDPRVLGPLQVITGHAQTSVVKCIAIDFQASFSNDTRATKLRERNLAGLQAIFSANGLNVLKLEPNDNDGIRSVSRNTAGLLAESLEYLGEHTDVIIDVSSFPRIIYLTIVNSLLAHFVKPNAERPLASDVNLHVVYAESADIDSRISKKEMEQDLASIQGLSIRMDEEVAEAWPKIWFPILGENNREILERISQLVTPDDVCPVLPMQTRNARRADNIMMEVGELLFDGFRVDPRGLLYATENNPFQLYRGLLGAMDRYADSLVELGGVRFILSPLSSKGLSIGALLACFEMKNKASDSKDRMRTGFAYLETRRYEAAKLSDEDHGVPVSLWLTGECYSGA